MTLEQVMQIDQEQLVSIGAHTLDHPFLARESDSKSQREIQSSIKQLETILGHPILSFAYPNGDPIEDFGRREIEILKCTTCKVAFSTDARDFSLSDSPYAIPRFGLSCGNIRFVKLKLFLGKHYIPLKKIFYRVKHFKL